MTKFLFADKIPASTFWRSAMFSLTKSRNCLISSSRLSFRSLCPFTAVTSFFFNRVSSILVGVTCVDAKISPLSSYYRIHFRTFHNIHLRTYHQYVSARFLEEWKAVSSQFSEFPQYHGLPYIPVKRIPAQRHLQISHK